METRQKVFFFVIADIAILLAIFFVWRSGALNPHLPSGAPAENSATIEPPLVGGDQDGYGCKGSAGYSWCETKQKCLRTWEELCDSEKVISCTPEQRKADVCAEIYQPVCATVQIQCVKAPCDPVRQTFENSCSACHNPLVSSYTEGGCAVDKTQ